MVKVIVRTMFGSMIRTIFSTMVRTSNLEILILNFIKSNLLLFKLY